MLPLPPSRGRSLSWQSEKPPPPALKPAKDLSIRCRSTSLQPHLLLLLVISL